jgi:long-chain acyl-CoA synthetase
MLANVWDMSDATVLTGATGFLGMEVLAQLAERDERPIIALIRAADQREADSRIAAVRSAIFGDPQAHADRIRALPANLESVRLGLSSRDRDDVVENARELIHSAASVSFDSPLAQARATNVDGTRRVLELAQEAREHGGLRHMVHVSTAYVAGDRCGSCRPEHLDALGPHRNTYERSKAEAEELVRNRARDLPVTVVRPSIVVGHSHTGWTSAFNVVYGPLRAFSLGALRVIPGRADATADIVPVDYVAHGITALAPDRPTGVRTVHLTAGDRAITVGALCEIGANYFGRPQPLILSPRLYRRAIHPIMVRTGPKKRRKALRASEIYLPYFAAQCSYETGRSRALLQRLGVVAPPPLEAYFDVLMAFARSAGWGKQVIPRAAAGGPAALRAVPSLAA